MGMMQTDYSTEPSLICGWWKREKWAHENGDIESFISTGGNAKGHEKGIKSCCFDCARCLVYAARVEVVPHETLSLSGHGARSLAGAAYVSACPGARSIPTADLAGKEVSGWSRAGRRRRRREAEAGEGPDMYLERGRCRKSSF